MKMDSKIAAISFAAAGLAVPAQAVQDLPGGPAVRQLNLHAAATRIAEEKNHKPGRYHPIECGRQ